VDGELFVAPPLALHGGPVKGHDRALVVPVIAVMGSVAVGLVMMAFFGR
jgi:hypothetical protein